MLTDMASPDGSQDLVKNFTKSSCKSTTSHGRLVVLGARDHRASRISTLQGIVGYIVVVRWMSKLAGGRTALSNDLAALPQSHPVRIVVPLEVATGTGLRIDAEIDRNIHQIGELGPRNVNAVEDDHISRWNRLQGASRPSSAIPVVWLEGGRLWIAEAVAPRLEADPNRSRHRLPRRLTSRRAGPR